MARRNSIRPEPEHDGRGEGEDTSGATEHRAEIRRVNRTTPVAATVVLVAVLVVLAFGPSGDDAPPTTTTSRMPAPAGDAGAAPPPPARTTPVRVSPVLALGTAGDALFVSSSAADAVAAQPTVSLDARAPVLVLGDRVAVLAADGRLLVGNDRRIFAELACCWDGLVPSSEPGHVWLVVAGARAVLVDLDVGPTGVELELDGDRVVGRASFGLVTTGVDGTIRWRRPNFTATEVTMPPDRVALGSGGGLLLVGSPTGRVEVRSVVDGAVVRSFGLPPAATPAVGDAVLASDGSTVAVPTGDGYDIRDAVGGSGLGALPAGGPPVWVGNRRFAVVDANRVRVSDGSAFRAFGTTVTIAERVGPA